jgi:hypothetical protein
VARRAPSTGDGADHPLQRGWQGSPGCITGQLLGVALEPSSSLRKSIGRQHLS